MTDLDDSGQVFKCRNPLFADQNFKQLLQLNLRKTRTKSQIPHPTASTGIEQSSGIWRVLQRLATIEDFPLDHDQGKFRFRHEVVMKKVGEST